MDLLLTADWAKLVKAQRAADQGLPILPSLAEGAPETVSISGRANNANTDSNQFVPPFEGSWLAMSFAIVGLIVAAIYWQRKP